MSASPRVLRQLIAMRKRAGLSQRAVARDIETQQSAISEMERGIASPTLDTLLRYAGRFGMDIVLTPVAADLNEGETRHG